MATTTEKPTAHQARERTKQRIVDAATELVRERSFARLTVGAVMERAGLERTIFYRHFDDLSELILSVGREAIEALYAAQAALAEARMDYGPAGVREAVEIPVRVYHRHGPVLRAVKIVEILPARLRPAKGLPVEFHVEAFGREETFLMGDEIIETHALGGNFYALER